MRKVIVLMLACSAMLLLAACSTVPYSKRTRIKLAVSKQQELEMGRKAWKEFKSSNSEFGVLSYRLALRRVAKNLIAVTKHTGEEWDFMVVDSRIINAFCLPGGKIAIYSALFSIVDNDAELAMVVAHEMAHAIARHTAERITHDILQQGIAEGVGELLDSSTIKNKTEILKAYDTVSELGVNLPYSRTHEYEADSIGLILVAEAGYSPEAAINFFRKFDRISKTQKFWGFLSTHPLTEDRTKNLLEKLTKAKEIYQSAPHKRGFGQIHGPDLGIVKINPETFKNE